jgi:hypothetical protein
MAALDTLRDRWRDVTTELLVRATRGISDGSRLNADHGRTETRARLDEWAGVLSLYSPEGESPSIRVSA